MLNEPAARRKNVFNRSYVDRLLADPEGKLTPKGHSKLWQVAVLEAWFKPMESTDHLPAGALKIGLSADSSHLIIRSQAPYADLVGDFSFGIEEEYFLADTRTFDVIRSSPDTLFHAANWQTGSQVTREFLQGQIEVATNIHTSFAAAGEELKFLRGEVARAAQQFGMVILACGTHPTAKWSEAVSSPKPRYRDMMDDLQMVGRRDLLCGMHVHVRIPDPDSRVDVMCRMIPYLPLFLALSTSSPFWDSRRTGLKGYRLAAYDELPRTRRARSLPQHGGVRALRSRPGGLGRHQRCNLFVVDGAAVADPSHAGTACHRLLHAD